MSVYEHDLVLNIPQGLICHKTQPINFYKLYIYIYI